MATRKNQGEFQEPVPDDTEHSKDNGQLTYNDEDQEISDDLAGYDPPASEDAMAVEAAQAESDAFMSNVDSQILSVKLQLEDMLANIRDETNSRAFGVQSQMAMDSNIVGVGIGIGDSTSTIGGAPGDPVLEVYTLEPETGGDLRTRLASVASISAFSDSDFPIHAVHTGIIDAQAHRMGMRPAPGGISVGHHLITAGTLGCLVRGRKAPRDRRLMILSNNHVLANVNGGPLGASIIQPGQYDGGSHPAHQVAILERFVPVNFASGSSNTVDCATGWAWAARVRRELMYVSGGKVNYFRIGATPVAPAAGMAVGKSGRTTQLTSGRITAVGVTINVNFGGGRVARFTNQFSVRASSGDFSAGGDSGSLVWTWDARRAPVGLLFAGGGGTTFCNPISSVLAALDVQIVS